MLSIVEQFHLNLFQIATLKTLMLFLHYGLVGGFGLIGTGISIQTIQHHRPQYRTLPGFKVF
eukprot:UN03401